MDTDNVTNELRPMQLLGLYIAQAQNGAYSMTAFKWAQEMYKKDAVRIESLLRDFGITDETIQDTPRFKEILEKGY